MVSIISPSLILIIVIGCINISTVKATVEGLINLHGLVKSYVEESAKVYGTTYNAKDTTNFPDYINFMNVLSALEKYKQEISEGKATWDGGKAANEFNNHAVILLLNDTRRALLKAEGNNVMLNALKENVRKSVAAIENSKNEGDAYYKQQAEFIINQLNDLYAAPLESKL